MSSVNYGLGCRLPVEEWAEFNSATIFEQPELAHFSAPFPPPGLMQVTTGLGSNLPFAQHGAHFWRALSEASYKPLSEYASVLDFGCGCGRLARYFKGFPGEFAGCDIDHRLVQWCDSALDYMTAKPSHIHPPIPFADDQFEAVISISIFTHLNEASQDEFLAELARVCRPGGRLFLTIHGGRALERAVNEATIRNLISVPDAGFEQARREVAEGKLAFILQTDSHMTSGPEAITAAHVDAVPFEYGITFTPHSYVRSHWSRWFDVLEIRSGAIHDFQDIVVLSPRKASA